MERPGISQAPRSPNIQVQPSSAKVDSRGHLVIGDCDTVELAERFGTPLWVLDQQTIVESVTAIKAGLSIYPNALGLYSAKAFACLAMCQLMKNLNMGLDVVSGGELHTAASVQFPADQIYLQGNNKSTTDIAQALAYGVINIEIDNESELELIEQLAQKEGVVATVLLRVIPGIDLDTHAHIKTGQQESKFGLPISDLTRIVAAVMKYRHIRLTGLHAHIGSQVMTLEPYLNTIDTLSNLYLSLKGEFGIDLAQLNVGGGAGIAYMYTDTPVPLYTWSREIASYVLSAFEQRHLRLPRLLLEPGRSIVGTAGVTLYRAGFAKQLPGGVRYLAVDGGMADNPRPITYQARYSACVANHADLTPSDSTPSSNGMPLTLVGRYCESGDVLIEDTDLDAQTGDIIAVFGTGAYNYSMSSNYNRVGRPACVLVSNGNADVIIERESNDDLLRNDRLPPRLL